MDETLFWELFGYGYICIMYCSVQSNLQKDKKVNIATIKYHIIKTVWHKNGSLQLSNVTLKKTIYKIMNKGKTLLHASTMHEESSIKINTMTIVSNFPKL